MKKLGKPLGVIRKRGAQLSSNVDKAKDSADVTMADALRDGDGDGDGGQHEEELEIVDVIEYKILFQGRPEPVGDT